jgi:hypothetical protein
MFAGQLLGIVFAQRFRMMHKMGHLLLTFNMPNPRKEVSIASGEK